MKRLWLAIGIALVIAVLHSLVASAHAREYVVMLSRNINIRTGPSTESVVVGRAWKGDIFELVGEFDNWHEIVMFSGEYRFVSKSWAAKLTESDISPGHRMQLPSTGETRRSIPRDIAFARARAKGEADEIIPMEVNTDRNAAFRAILEDRFIMEVMQIYSVQPALYPDLMD